MDLGQDTLGELVGVPCIQTVAKVIFVRFQVSYSQTFKRTDSLIVEAGRLVEPLRHRLPSVLGARFQGRSQRGARNGVGQNGQYSDEQIAIQLVHIDPLRRLLLSN